MHVRDVVSLTVLGFAALFFVGMIDTFPARAAASDSAVPAEGRQAAPLADEANLSRSTAGQTFEDDSHSIHEEASRFEGSDHFDRHHDLEGEHERSESEHGGEGEHGGGSESGGGDSGGGSEGGGD